MANRFALLNDQQDTNSDDDSEEIESNDANLNSTVGVEDYNDFVTVQKVKKPKRDKIVPVTTFGVMQGYGSLEEEIVGHILSYLSGIDICHAARSCVQFRNGSKKLEVWQRAFERDFKRNYQRIAKTEIIKDRMKLYHAYKFHYIQQKAKEKREADLERGKPNKKDRNQPQIASDVFVYGFLADGKKKSKGCPCCDPFSF